MRIYSQWLTGVSHRHRSGFIFREVLKMALSIAASISSLVSKVKQEYNLRPASFLVIEAYNQQIQDIFDKALSNDAFICWQIARDQSGNIVNIIKYSDNSILAVHLDVPESHMRTNINCRVNWDSGLSIDEYIAEHIK